MASKPFRDWEDRFWRSLDHHGLPTLPRLIELGHFSNELQVVKTQNKRLLDYDPHVRRTGEKFIDAVALDYLLQAFGTLKLDSDVISDIYSTRTRSSFTDRRNTSLELAIEHAAVPEFQPRSCIPEDLLHEVFEQMIRDYMIPELQPKSWSEINWRAGSFSGMPKCTRKDGPGVYDAAVDDVEKMLQYTLATGFSPMTAAAYIALSRTQLSDVDNPKIRLVWAAPFANLLLQLSIWQPFYEHLQSTKRGFGPGRSSASIFGLTLEEANEQVSNLISIADTTREDHPDAILLVTDWPAFDTGKEAQIDSEKLYCKSVQPWEILFAFKVLFHGYKHLQHQQGHTRTAAILGLLMVITIYKRILFPGHTYHVTGMIASGDGGTYALDSIINRMRMIIWSRMISIPLKFVLTGGDDGLALLLKGISDWFRQIVEPMYEMFGTVVQPPPKGQLALKHLDIKFHGHYWTPATHLRDFETVIALLLFRERSHNINFEKVPLSSDLDRRSSAGLTLARVRGLIHDTGDVYRFLNVIESLLLATYPGLTPIPDEDISWWTPFASPK